MNGWTTGDDMSNRPTARRTTGFTVIELTVVLAVFVILNAVVWQTLSVSGTAVQETLNANELDTTLRRVVDRVSDELKDSGSDQDSNDHVTSHPAGTTTTSSSLSFRRRLGFTGNSSDWGDDITYALQPSPGEIAGNGADDDDDGVVDEQQVARTQSGETVIIADGVTHLEFGRDEGDYKITFEISVSRTLSYDQSPVTRTIFNTVGLRNKP